MVNIVDKYTPRKFSAFSSNSGIVLCDDAEGCFLVLRFTEDLERLQRLLAKIDITKVSNGDGAGPMMREPEDTP